MIRSPMKLYNPTLTQALACLMVSLLGTPLPAQTEESGQVDVSVEISQSNEASRNTSPSDSARTEVRKETRISQSSSKPSRYGLGGGMGGGMGGFGGGGANLNLLLSDGADSGRSIVYTTSDMDDKTRQQLKEDLAVMSHLLRKNVRKEVGSSGDEFAKFNLFTGDQSLKSAYLDGFGALFFMSVKYPLAAAPQEEDDEEKSPASSPTEWELARQELYGGTDNAWISSRRSGDVRLWDVSREPFSQEKVEDLKNTIISTLVNAANIRSIKPEESVVVFVSAPGQVSSDTVNAFATRTDREVRDTVILKQLGRSNENSKSTTLMISARKSDIQALAAREIALEDFKKKVKITMD